MQATHIKDKKTAEQIAQKIASAKLNSVFILVYYWGGKSFFRTDHAPHLNDTINKEDLFRYFIEECHKRGIKVFARISNGHEGARGTDGILSDHPQWQIQNIYGERRRWFDLGKKDVKELQMKLLSDLLNNYPVDGIQLDYIRFPSPDYCYCEECRGDFQNYYHIDPIELYYALPISLYLVSVPLQKITGAKVIARFENGTPAITFKEHELGWLLFFNWQINRSSLPLFLQILRNALEGHKRVYIPLPRKELGYEEDGFAEILKALKNARIDLKMIGRFEDIEVGNSLLLLPALQRLGDKVVDELKNFLSTGGEIIVSLGREGIIGGRGWETLLGIGERGRALKGYYSIIPVENHPLLPVFPDTPQKRRELIVKWADFRKELITSLVGEFYKKLKVFNSGHLLSAAVFYNRSSAEGVLQDWYKWLESGIIDFVAPMAYVDDKRLRSALKEWKGYDPTLEKIIPGLSIYQVKNGKEVPKGKQAVLRQIKIIKDEGARGFILFSLPFLTEDLARELAKL